MKKVLIIVGAEIAGILPNVHIQGRNTIVRSGDAEAILKIVGKKRNDKISTVILDDSASGHLSLISQMRERIGKGVQFIFRSNDCKKIPLLTRADELGWTISACTMSEVTRSVITD